MYCKDCRHRRNVNQTSLGYPGGVCTNDSAMGEDCGQSREEADKMIIYPYFEGGCFYVGDNFGCVNFEQKENNTELRQRERVMEASIDGDVGLTLTVCGALLGALGVVVYVGLTVLHNVYGGL